MSCENGKTILLVENKNLASISWQKNLEKCGYAVIKVYSGEQALEKVKKKSGIDLILMNNDLEDEKDGFLAAEQILGKHDLPLVFILTSPEPETVEKVESVTSYGFVTGKSSMAEVNSYIKMVLQLFQAYEKTRKELAKRKRAESQIKERNKELHGFFKLSEVVERKSSSFDELYQEFTNILPGTLQYPEIACARIVIDKCEYTTENFKETAWMQSAPIYVNKSEVGKIEVGYLEDYSENRKDPFLTEERRLLNALAERLGRITEHKRSEEELKIKEKYMRGILESQNDLIVRVDLENRFNYVNDAYCKTFGKTSEELIGKPFVPLVHEEDIENTLKAMEKLYVPPYRVYMEQRAMTVHGWRWIAWEDTGILNDEGEVVEIQGVGRDITEQKRAEQALQETLNEKDVLLSEMHHRVKNNMAVISSMITLQTKYFKNKASDKLLEDITGRIDSMALVHEIVYENQDFAEINIEELLNRLANHLKNIYQSNDKEISLQIKAEDITMDMNKSVPFTLLVNEILTNAWKHAFTECTTGRIEVSLEKNQDAYQLVIQDDGKGISDVSRLNNPDSFGYTIIHGLAQQLQGQLDISSSPERGLKVAVWFSGKKGHLEKLTKAG